MNDLFLVTGATGPTGRAAIQELRGKGARVRAFVHGDDKRADALRDLGAEVVVGDLLDFAAVRAAAKGVTAAYFVYPIRAGLVDATAYFAQAAVEAGIKAIVNMSQISARPMQRALRRGSTGCANGCWIEPASTWCICVPPFSLSGCFIGGAASQ